MRDQPGMVFTGALALLVLIASLLGVILDPRVITGEPVWLKPAKFGVSFAICAASLTWMLSLIKPNRWVRLAGIMTAIGFSAEAIIVFVQVLRGERSHFNIATPFDSTLWSLMGVFIIVIWLAGLIAAALIWRAPNPEPALALLLKYGVALMLIGALLGSLMSRPTHAQRDTLEAGQRPNLIGSHSVSVPEDGPRLPVMGWSTTGGDGRVAHFVGLHALQVLPLIGWWIGRRSRWQVAQRTGLMTVAALGYSGMVALLVWQAGRGQSVVAPDATILMASALLIAVMALSSALILMPRAPRKIQNV